MIPPEFWGAWRRVSIALGDDPPHEPASVDWLQGPSAFADLRLPDAPGELPLCFAGITTWASPSLTWHHDLDLGTEIGADTGVVEWCGDDLVERGVFVILGESTPYVEVWRRASAGIEGIALLRRGDDGAVSGRLVRVGETCLVVEDDRPTGGELTAAHLQRDPATGGWATLRSLGPAPPMRALDSRSELSERIGWEVVEEWP